MVVSGFDNKVLISMILSNEFYPIDLMTIDLMTIDLMTIDLMTID